MKPLVVEWVAKAEGDFAIVERECRARRNPCYDGACFHAQQCAEKYFKARLCAAGLRVEKVHDLSCILESALPVEPMWEAYREALAFLSGFAVAFRYPGESADRTTALRARTICRSFRAAARQALHLVDAARAQRRAGRRRTGTRLPSGKFREHGGNI